MDRWLPPAGNLNCGEPSEQGVAYTEAGVGGRDGWQRRAATSSAGVDGGERWAAILMTGGSRTGLRWYRWRDEDDDSSGTSPGSCDVPIRGLGCHSSAGDCTRLAIKT